MLPVMYVSVGAHFAHLDTGVSRDVSYISVTGQVCPGATTESRRLAAWGLGVGSYQSGESEETCRRHGSPASWLQAAHTFCVKVLKAHPSVDSKLCLSVRKVEFAYSDRDKLEWGLALKEFLSEIISVSY